MTRHHRYTLLLTILLLSAFTSLNALAQGRVARFMTMAVLVDEVF